MQHRLEPGLRRSPHLAGDDVSLSAAERGRGTGRGGANQIPFLRLSPRSIAGRECGGSDAVGSAGKIQACQTPESFRGRLLKDISVTQRGWTLDVLNIVRRLTEEKRQRAGALQDASRGSGVTGKRASVLDCPPSAVMLRRTGGGPPPLSEGPEFTTADAYAFERELAELHPDNDHIKEKIRQQLQVLRDAGLLVHLGRGEWRLP